jgi:hypothetical protein
MEYSAAYKLFQFHTHPAYSNSFLKQFKQIFYSYDGDANHCGSRMQIF